MTDQEHEPALLDMDQVKVDPNWALRIPGNLALRRRLLPFTMHDNHVLVACSNIEDEQGLKAVERYVVAPVLPQAAEAESLDRAIQRIFRDSIQGTFNQSQPGRTNFSVNLDHSEPDGETIVALGDEIFHAAFIRQATDIHIEPRVNDVRVRLRVDGILEDYREIPSAIHSALVSRLKVLAGMDIAERRAPQDGRFSIGSDKTQVIDVRAATIPTKQGERMTLRLLATNTHKLTLENLGMSPQHNQLFEASIAQPNGLVLLTGPTGCGKSTTLYAAIRNLLRRKSLNIITIEDPVEYVIDGISQVEVDTADKVNFHKALRSSLRHDPDVLMIGEIRDEITAETAIKAALTGHLVFTTLHTNSAASSITRLVDMGVAPYLIAAVSRVFVAQRLVRKLCRYCRQTVPISTRQAQALNRDELADDISYRPVGCKYCSGSGFHGRTGLFEILAFDQELAKLVAAGVSQDQVDECVHASGATLLMDDAIAKIKNGTTSFDEVVSILNLL